MEAKFLDSFNALKGLLESKVPELGNVVAHWEDPFMAPKSRAIMLPDKSGAEGGRIAFSVLLCASTVEKNADSIAEAQMLLMEKLFKVVCGRLPTPIIGAEVSSADYFDPAPQSPNVGVLRAIIALTLDYDDDCEG